MSNSKETLPEKSVPAKEEKKNTQNGRFIYLITYSKADLLIVGSCEKFAQIICDEFNRHNDDVVLQWACCVENHTERGVHFHMSIKLKARRRFGEVRDNLQSKYRICVNFTEWATFYYDAFTYVVKQDPHYITSKGHPPLDNSPLRERRFNRGGGLVVILLLLLLLQPLLQQTHKIKERKRRRDQDWITTSCISWLLATT